LRQAGKNTEFTDSSRGILLGISSGGRHGVNVSPILPPDKYSRLRPISPNGSSK
jgi:hypothetical protein